MKISDSETFFRGLDLSEKISKTEVLLSLNLSEPVRNSFSKELDELKKELTDLKNSDKYAALSRDK